jgi:LysM repeat protein
MNSPFSATSILLNFMLLWSYIQSGRFLWYNVGRIWLALLLETSQLGGFMRTKFVVLIMLLVLLLAACSNSDIPADVFPVDNGANMSATDGAAQEQESPRVEVTPTPPLPPTYTPAAMAHQGHLYLLPVSGAAGEVQWVYTVQPGDTLSAISEMYDVSFADVVRVNDLTDPNHIEAGTQLIIPIADS